MAGLCSHRLAARGAHAPRLRPQPANSPGSGDRPAQRVGLGRWVGARAVASRALPAPGNPLLEPVFPDVLNWFEGFLREPCFSLVLVVDLNFWGLNGRADGVGMPLWGLCWTVRGRGSCSLHVSFTASMPLMRAPEAEGGGVRPVPMGRSRAPDTGKSRIARTWTRPQAASWFHGPDVCLGT